MQNTLSDFRDAPCIVHSCVRVCVCVCVCGYKNKEMANIIMPDTARIYYVIICIK